MVQTDSPLRQMLSTGWGSSRRWCGGGVGSWSDIMHKGLDVPGSEGWGWLSFERAGGGCHGCPRAPCSGGVLVAKLFCV